MVTLVYLVPDYYMLVASGLILGAGALGAAFALINFFLVFMVKRIPYELEGESANLVQEEGRALSQEVVDEVVKISKAITVGSNAFLFSEYKYMAVFVVLFSFVIFVPLAFANGIIPAIFSVVAFVWGCTTSIVSGYIGMSIAVYANSRTAISACHSIGSAFRVAFRAGIVMGFALVALGLINLYIMIILFKLIYFHSNVVGLMESVSAFGLGGSSIALFGRVGGGIYTKAADVGADLVGKVEQGIPEDDPRNPAVIADNVGDNVGDIAGMGADLFGSFGEATCAALVIGSTSHDPSFTGSWNAMMFPILITATGIIACILTSFVATNIQRVGTAASIEPTLKTQLVVSTVILTPALFALSWFFLPYQFTLYVGGSNMIVHNWEVFICVASGLWCGLAIGFVTEYYTSHSFRPVREVASACQTGAATNVIFGLALGYQSTIIPVFAMALVIFTSYALASMYGIAVAALGILSNMCIGLTIDAYGPISDNAGGIAEMAGMGSEIRERTDALDAAGNTTAAVGKGFAISSAALVSLALFGAFTTRAEIEEVNLMAPRQFAGLLVGAMLPYWFSAMTMKSVGKAALAMVEEVRRQFHTIEGLMERTAEPDYAACVSISTAASLREMILPGVLVIGSPIITGFIFGKEALSGLLAGSLVSGVQMAISSSNTGGAWDNAKKYIESGKLGGKHSDAHKAAVIGDTVGDPLKDTSGPALNILMKLQAIISLVFAPAILQFGGLLFIAWDYVVKNS